MLKTTSHRPRWRLVSGLYPAFNASAEKATIYKKTGLIKVAVIICEIENIEVTRDSSVSVMVAVLFYFS